MVVIPRARGFGRTHCFGPPITAKAAVLDHTRFGRFIRIIQAGWEPQQCYRWRGSSCKKMLAETLKKDCRKRVCANNYAGRLIAKPARYSSGQTDRIPCPLP